jgi:hypothetical protein
MLESRGWNDCNPTCQANEEPVWYPAQTKIEFNGKIWTWRGPAPWHFISVPSGLSRELHSVMRAVTYGWGMIPVVARIGETQWKTSMWPKDGRYILPIKASVREAASTLATCRIPVQHA